MREDQQAQMIRTTASMAEDSERPMTKELLTSLGRRAQLVVLQTAEALAALPS